MLADTKQEGGVNGKTAWGTLQENGGRIRPVQGRCTGIYLHEKECTGSWQWHFFPPSLFWLEKMNPDANTATISPENLTSEPVNCQPEFTPGIEQGGSVPGDPLPPLSSPDTPEWPVFANRGGFPVSAGSLSRTNCPEILSRTSRIQPCWAARTCRSWQFPHFPTETDINSYKNNSCQIALLP
jgi:hypothetical protein